MNELLIIALVAFLVSVVAGMLGLGGAVLLIPAFLYLVPLLGGKAMGMHDVSGLASVTVLASSTFSMLVHRRRGNVDRRLVFTIGVPMVGMSLLGAFLSGGIDAELIKAVFAAMALLGAALVILRREHQDPDTQEPLHFSRIGAIAIAVGVGFFGGIAGAPGAFILSPLMMTVLKIPTRITIGSTLGIALMSALAASIGKISTGQVPLEATAVAILATLPGSYIGSSLSHRMKTRSLRHALALVIGGVAVHMWYQIISG